ncbi:MAG: response regulator [Anaerolineae bacterium]|nr:response regulator [Anaerolineae bacterium]
MAQPHRNVLVVEDRRDWQDILCTALDQRGYKPYPAFSYQDALVALKDKNFSLAIVDPVLDMANRFNRDGLSIVQKIRETQPEIPVIVLTGSLTHDMAISLRHLDPDAPVMFKESWDPSQFYTLVDKLIGDSLPKATQSKKNENATVPASGSMVMPPPPETARGRPRVLLVENRKDWQEIVSTILADRDCFWRVAETAPEALAHLEQEGFHLVILDLKLQATDLPLRSNEGWLLLDYLVENHPKTKVVVLSGRAGPSDVADLLTKYPVIGFIEKQHFTPQAIEEAIAQAAKLPALRLQTLGQFQIWRDGIAIGIWENASAEEAIKLLLARRAKGGRAVTVDEFKAHLWPLDNSDNASKKLLPLINNIRLTLEPDIEARHSNFILREANGYCFDIDDAVTWDLIDFRDKLGQGRQFMEHHQWSAAIECFEASRTIYKGDFLAEDRNIDWVIDTRREVVSEFCTLLTLLADAYAATANYTPAIAACEEALEKDPLLEEVYRRLMYFHSCNGQKESALKTYRDCLKVFEELFGESPTSATRQLYQTITNDEGLDCPPIPQVALKENRN